MRATTAMTRKVVVVPPELTLLSAWHVMTRERIRHLPVVRSGALIGMLSDRDVLARGTLAADGTLRVPADLLVGEAMTPTPLLTCDEDTDVSELARTMTEAKVDAVPVVVGLRLVGLVTSSDLLQLLIHRDPVPLPFRFQLVDEDAAFA